MTELMQPHMAQADLFAWNMEQDPLLRSTIVAVAVLDRSPDWDRFVAMMDRGSRLVPAFRRVVVPAPLGMAPPRWVVDDDFDLSWHLRRVRLPDPGSFDDVLDFARCVGMQAFDPARPLWEFTVLDGLDDGRAAIVMKIHHALTDGIGGMQIASEIVDLEREGTERGPMPEPPPPTRTGPLDGLSDSLAWNAALAWDLARQGSRELGPMLRRTVTDPLGAGRSAAALAGSVARFVRPVVTTRSPIMRERRLGWRYAVSEVPFEDLHDAARRHGGTLNDAFMAGVLIGLRRYHERHGATVPELVVTMPISTRGEGDDIGGNRVTLVRFPLPLEAEDPAELMRAVDERVAAWRREPAVPWSSAIAGVLNLLPSQVLGGMLKHVDFLASNVPGTPVPLYVAGGRVERYYAFGPTIGAAVNVTLMSYVDTCCIGVNADVGAVPDVDELRECLAEGFAVVVGGRVDLTERATTGASGA
jgi:diacylglycerol O-acyltransferase / wax synthase